MARSQCFWARGSFWIDFFRSRIFMQKKVMRGKLRELSFGVVGPLNYPKRGPQSPEAQGPRAKANSPESKRTIENHRLVMIKKVGCKNIIGVIKHSLEKKIIS